MCARCQQTATGEPSLQQLLILLSRGGLHTFQEAAKLTKLSLDTARALQAKLRAKSAQEKVSDSLTQCAHARRILPPTVQPLLDTWEA